MPNTRFLNMDLVRYLLSIAVIIAHYNIICGVDVPFPISSGTAVGVFFGLSGYLVYGSYLKYTDLKRYIRGRAQRILPPYLFIILVCAFGLAIVSQLSVTDYFCSADLWKYIAANVFFLNFLHPDLPGVFDGNAINAVNGSLWTLKVEWVLYLSIPLFFWGVKRYKWNVPIAIIVICLCSFAYTFAMQQLADKFGNPIYYKFSYQFIGQLAYFYTGVLVYHYKEHLINRNWWSMLIVAICTYALIECNIFNLDLSYISYIKPMLLVFATLLFSLSKSISHYTSILGNVSYEMYLFHFPVIQLFVHYHLNQHLTVGYGLLLVIFIIITISFVFQKTYKYLQHSSHK